ncbi:hypothetical protein Astex_0095 [Asticcacaulis excentricus CB 48]|uniref:Uncharacterized protein n=1 Tax=Asticcacaulis excentricus (strain ATCC 15261 / DSM 4724 / KCTC 12464 / NCIMB 9791 / VKM B-1370 / CB 48) TaxID=573065 RepID=E8RNG6_ASTEC|nr:hypothetical protein Astex_0095 [Asticcacaulis excentricus CB 48]
MQVSISDFFTNKFVVVFLFFFNNLQYIYGSI